MATHELGDDTTGLEQMTYKGPPSTFDSAVAPPNTKNPDPDKTEITVISLKNAAAQKAGISRKEYDQTIHNIAELDKFHFPGRDLAFNFRPGWTLQKIQFSNRISNALKNQPADLPKVIRTLDLSGLFKLMVTNLDDTGLMENRGFKQSFASVKNQAGIMSLMKTHPAEYASLPCLCLLTNYSPEQLVG